MDPFPFLQLPKEVRLMIYEYIIVVGSARYIQTEYRNDYHVRLFAQSYMERVTKDPFNTSLLYVCKAMSKECLNIFYLQNTFHLAEETLYNLSSCRLSHVHESMQHLAFRVTDQDDYTYIFHTIQGLSRLPNLTSCTLILSDDRFEHDISKRSHEVVSSELGYECSVAMLKLLDLLKYWSQSLSKLRSRKLKVYSPYHPSATHLLMSATHRHEADKYLDSLHVAFGGELWINDILYRCDGIQIGRLPFPFGCCRFDPTKVSGYYFAACIRQIRLGKLFAAFGEEKLGGINEEFLENDRTASAAFSLSPLANGSIYNQIQAYLHQARECFDSLYPAITDQDLTEGLLEQRLHEWTYAFDPIMARLPDPEPFPINTFWGRRAANQ